MLWAMRFQFHAVLLVGFSPQELPLYPHCFATIPLALQHHSIEFLLGRLPERLLL